MRARARYKSSLATSVAASAGPYGYTLTIWTTGAVLSHARGLPSTVDALLFLLGAVAAYGGIASLAVRGLTDHVIPGPVRSAVWGGLHFVTVGLAIGVASGIAHLVQDTVAWPVGGFFATAVYLLGSASQLALTHARRRGRQD